MIVNRLARGGSHAARDIIPVDAATASIACFVSSVIVVPVILCMITPFSDLLSYI